MERLSLLLSPEVDMDARAKLLGHPIHQMLIVFPLGLLATSFFFDIAWLVTARADLALVSFWMIITGVIFALLAAVFGLIDWLSIPRNTRARAIGVWHGLGNVVVTVLFAVSWFTRYTTGPRAPIPTAIFLSGLGVSIALVTGWLGGELVDRLGVGVDDGAHLDSPNSLSGRPASERSRTHHIGT
jgi:uncharacterized membrane protein